MSYGTAYFNLRCHSVSDCLLSSWHWLRITSGEQLATESPTCENFLLQKHVCFSSRRLKDQKTILPTHRAYKTLFIFIRDKLHHLGSRESVCIKAQTRPNISQALSFPTSYKGTAWLQDNMCRILTYYISTLALQTIIAHPNSTQSSYQCISSFVVVSIV